MTIEKAIEVIEYSRAFNKENTPLMKAWDLIIDCVRAQQDAAKNVVEVCPHCETEIEMRWDIDTQGYKAFCPVCGNRLMLCDECQHTVCGDYIENCDYDSETDSCRHNRPPVKEAPNG